MESRHRIYPTIRQSARELRQPQTPAEARLLIEIDGDSHSQEEQLQYDQVRTEYLEGLDYQLIRFANNDVRYNINAVIAKIMEEVESRIKELEKNVACPSY